MSTTMSGTRAEILTEAIRDRLPHNARWTVRSDPDHDAVELTSGPDAPGTVVIAAITDDTATDAVVAHARLRARELNTPLRVVHVWTDRDRDRDGVRMRPELLPQADAFVTSALYDCLPPGEAADAERQIVHDSDPGRALLALSRDAALLVVAAAGEASVTAGPVGSTVSTLIGHTACPLAVVMPPRRTPPSWWT